MERSDAVDNQRRIRPALAYNQRSVELAGGQDADEIEELPLALSASKQSQSVFVCWFVHSFVRSFVCLFVGWLVHSFVHFFVLGEMCFQFGILCLLMCHGVLLLDEKIISFFTGVRIETH